MRETHLILICLLGFVASDNTTIDHSITEDVSEIANSGNDLEADVIDQSLTWGESSSWSKWSACSRSCDGGISRQQRRCRRKPCKGRSTRYKLCNLEPCEKRSDFRAEQCAAFDDVPYSGQLLKWYPHYDLSRPCALICRGEQSLENPVNRLQQETSNEKTLQREPNDSLQFDREETIVVQLADKVEDGTKCNRVDALGVCIDGECMKFGCDLKVGSNKVYDACGVCGGNGSSCQTRYSWRLEAISACSKFCGGGVQLAIAVCKTIGAAESVVDDSYCDPNGRPEKTMTPCNAHSCSAKWVTGEWSKCSASCGGGSRARAVFCTEENGNETTKLPDHKCSGTHKPRYQETCNTISCPMWETNKWSECSVTCGNGIRRRTIECRDGNGNMSSDCDPMERPRIEQECKTSIDCPTYGEDLTQPLMQPYPPPPMPEKLIDQPIPSESTFIAEEWSPCSVTCGEGIRHREVYCKIFLDFSRTIAMLPDTQCSGPKPVETEKCTMEPCSLMGNSLTYRIDTVGDSGYVEASLTDTYRSPSGSSSGSGYEGGIKVASGSVVQTSYSWKEAGYTPCSTTCLGGVQDLIINCVRDDTGKTVTPLLCSVETKPEARIRVCNDHPCPPRWNYSDFSPCTSPCGIGVQTRDVICIHEVTRGAGKTVPVPSHMCPKPPPVDRRYCNVWDCPIKWSTGEWGKCSKTCGGGVKKRKVTCAQIMAQGRTQNREDRECPSQKPPTEKPCNTRSCHDMDANVQPIILSQNTTFNQTDFNGKVDLKIGGLAKVFQGTQYIKIRCPVKKFDKAQIVWKKDNKEIRKSRKYKITRKGALKIIDITSSDSGVYSCVAGQSHAETRLIVKFRSKEQISSEEYMRLGNSVHLQRNVNLDSAPANSGESLYTDRTAAYGNRFAPIDSEDLSHERAVPTGAKTTRRPHQKKQKPSPTPPDSTMMHKEHTVTSLNQPGYHESVESTVPSSASALVPHISYLISSLKAYWPFRSDVNSKSHRTAPVSFIDDVRKETIGTKHAVPDRKAGLRYQNVEDNLDNFYRNTAIPDKTFGPDEERIFIDVDPYDLDDSIFDPLHTETIKFSSIHPENEERYATSAGIDYVEESLKNVKRHWQDTRNFLRNERDNTDAREYGGKEGETTLDSFETEIRYIPDSSTKGIMQKSGSSPSEGNGKSMNRESYENQDSSNSYVAVSKNLEQTTELSDSEDEETLELMNKTDGYGEGFEEDFKKRTVDTYKENDMAESGIGRGLTTKNLENKEKEDAPVTEDRGEMGKYPEKNVSLEFSRGHQENSNDGSKEPLKSRPLKTDKSIDRLILSGANVTSNSTIGSLTALDGDELLFEWVTTDWSKCSQTCGGSGFQMRGAQCTVRSGKPIGNSTRISTRTVIGATLCEDAGHPVPQKVRSCGSGRCPQWHTTEWTTCETSRCFNWKTAMQRRDITCRLVEDLGNGEGNITLLDPNKCDEATRPLQRQECYNDACKGVWRVGEWSECTASCEEDGIKYRILQCVWYGTKKPAGNACRDIPRPPVMKTCRGPPCPQSPEECKDHSQLCSRVKMMNMCKVPLYQKQCCESCR